MTEQEIKDLKVAHVMCIQSFVFFVRYFFKALYKRKWKQWDHLLQIAEALEGVVNGDITRLIINVAPRYGKTELAVKFFIAYCLALNPEAKFIHLSYSDDLALDNSEIVKDIITSEEYQRLFPYVQLKEGTKAKKKWYTKQNGGVYATSAGGQITGFGAGKVDEDAERLEDNELASEVEDLNSLINSVEWLGKKALFGGAIIIDDPNKPDDADSDTLRSRVNERYDSTISNRVNSRNTPIIILQQRTHEQDLSGYLIEKQGIIGEKTKTGKDGIWTVLSLPSIKADGTALCPDKHTLEELNALKEHNDIVFERQHMQNPKPRAGLLFPSQDLHYFSGIIEDEDYSYLPADPAGEGGDFFASLVLKIVEDRIYVDDVLFNQLGTDINEERTVNLILSNNIRKAGIEGVFGWAETVARIRSELAEKGYEGEVRMLRPRTAKHSRILARSAFIRNHFYFRSDTEDRPEYKKFMENLTRYLRIQAPGASNKHDDAPDVCEMGAAFFEREFPHVFKNP